MVLFIEADDATEELLEWIRFSCVACHLEHGYGYIIGTHHTASFLSQRLSCYRGCGLSPSYILPGGHDEL